MIDITINIKRVFKFYNLIIRDEISNDELKLKQLLKQQLNRRVNFIRSIEYSKRDNFTARLIINLVNGEQVSKLLLFQTEGITLEKLCHYTITNLRGHVWWL